MIANDTFASRFSFGTFLNDVYGYDVVAYFDLRTG